MALSLASTALLALTAHETTHETMRAGYLTRGVKRDVSQRVASPDAIWNVNLTIRSFVNQTMELVECYAEQAGGSIKHMPRSIPPATYRKDIGMWDSKETTLLAESKGLGHSAGRCIFKITGAQLADPPAPWYTWCLGHDCDDFYTSAPAASNATGASCDKPPGCYQSGLGNNVGLFHTKMTMCICMPDHTSCDLDCVAPDPPSLE